jgi:hypothetical protein
MGCQTGVNLFTTLRRKVLFLGIFVPNAKMMGYGFRFMGLHKKMEF